MDKIQTLIEQACDDTEGLRFREEYSGRSMRGTGCIGVVGSWMRIHQMIADVIKYALDEAADAARDAETDEELEAADQLRSDAHAMIDEIMQYKWDSMGFDIIIYWPSIEPLDEEDTDEDEEDQG